MVELVRTVGEENEGEDGQRQTKLRLSHQYQADALTEWNLQHFNTSAVRATRELGIPLGSNS